MHIHDLIVIGAGGVGSAVLRSAATRGWDVVGLEQFGAAHDRGSSHGQTRIIRAAYFEHPNYVPMALRSFEMWHELQVTWKLPIFNRSGLVQLGSPDSAVIKGVLRSANDHQLTIERMTANEVEQRWPAFRVAPTMVGVFESGAGILRVENAVAHTLAQAKAAGAKLHTNSRVVDWQVDDAGVVHVQTTTAKWVARQLVVAAGPWAQRWLKFPDELQSRCPLLVRRKQQNWFHVDRADVHVAAGFPCFLVDDPNGCFYGFPEIDRLGMKIAEHSGGQSVDDPDALDRRENETDVRRAQCFAETYFRFGRMRLSHSSTCMYTMSPDENFVVDLHPNFPQVAMIAGLSGHGFKFAPVLGEQAIRLLEGNGIRECDFLRLNRESLSIPVCSSSSSPAKVG